MVPGKGLFSVSTKERCVIDKRLVCCPNWCFSLRKIPFRQTHNWEACETSISLRYTEMCMQQKGLPHPQGKQESGRSHSLWVHVGGIRNPPTAFKQLVLTPLGWKLPAWRVHRTSPCKRLGYKTHSFPATKIRQNITGTKFATLGARGPEVLEKSPRVTHLLLW